MAGIGELGEIVVRTPYLARGYLKNQALTKERYLQNPFTQISGDQIYRTGDMGRFRVDGCIDFAGRRDAQVKIRGARVDLREIEFALSQHAAIKKAVVTKHHLESREKRLVAYFIASQNEKLESNELRKFLGAKLPEYMVPSTFVRVEALPLTSNGKIDYTALPNPSITRPVLKNSIIPPNTAIEKALSDIWSTVLGLKHVGIRDNFFELGGHSLLAVKLMDQIKKNLGSNLPIATLFHAQTIEQLACIINKEKHPELRTLSVPIQTKGTHPLFFMVNGENDHVISNYLGDDQPYYRLLPEGLDAKIPQYSSIESLADALSEEIMFLQPNGPFILGGYCFGSVVAFEIAQKLQEKGHEVPVLVMIDPPPPGKQPSPNGKFHEKKPNTCFQTFL